MHSLHDTIAAIASAPGAALRGIVRTSGPDVLAVVRACFRPGDDRDLAAVRRATVIPGELRLPRWHSPPPCDLYLWPTVRSYTRQPVAEFHTLGSPPLLDGLLQALCTAGARLAAPGEFTLRAFMAGRIDLTQAEGVLGVIDATDRRALNTALAQLAGGLSQPLHALRERLLDLLARLEAGLDFVEEDIEFVTADEIQTELTAAATLVGDLTARLRTRATVGDAPRVVLHGAPNVGKSSLFNALVRRAAARQHSAAPAIVTNIPGTTRDYLAARLDCHGQPCELIDTAGVETAVPVDVAIAPQSIAAAAQLATAARQSAADVELFCVDATRPWSDWEQTRAATPATIPRIIVRTKLDAVSPNHPLRDPLWEANPFADECADQPANPPVIAVSSHTGQGLDNLLSHVARCLTTLGTNESSVVGATAVRCGDSLRRAAETLAAAQAHCTTRAGDELIAAELRLALDDLAQVVGAVHTDDLLDRIFSRFCIGK